MSRMSEARDRLNVRLGKTNKAKHAKAFKAALDAVMADPHLREQMLAQIDKRKFYDSIDETADEEYTRVMEENL